MISNSLNIDFMHGDTHDRSCKKHSYITMSYDYSSKHLLLRWFNKISVVVKIWIRSPIQQNTMCIHLSMSCSQLFLLLKWVPSAWKSHAWKGVLENIKRKNERCDMLKLCGPCANNDSPQRVTHNRFNHANCAGMTRGPVVAEWNVNNTSAYVWTSGLRYLS